MKIAMERLWNNGIGNQQVNLVAVPELNQTLNHGTTY